MANENIISTEYLTWTQLCNTISRKQVCVLKIGGTFQHFYGSDTWVKKNKDFQFKQRQLHFRNRYQLLH